MQCVLIQDESRRFGLYGRTFERQIQKEEKITRGDAYKIANLLQEVEEGRDAINVILSKDRNLW
jgi:hypothetical protein